MDPCIPQRSKVEMQSCLIIMTRVQCLHTQDLAELKTRQGLLHRECVRICRSTFKIDKC